MKWRNFFAITTLLASGLTMAAEHAANTAVKGDPKAGETKAAVCGACHGVDGNSPTNQYPKLAGQHEDYIARQLALYKSNKRVNPVMLGFASQLNEQDMHDIGAYFSTKQSIPGVADDKVLARGSTLYRGGDNAAGVPACMACHGPDGRGNSGSAYPQLSGQYADYVSAKLKEFHDGVEWSDDEKAKIMPKIAKRLTNADITALSSYIEGLHSTNSGDTAAK